MGGIAIRGGVVIDEIETSEFRHRVGGGTGPVVIRTAYDQGHLSPAIVIRTATESATEGSVHSLPMGGITDQNSFRSGLEFDAIRENDCRGVVFVVSLSYEDGIDGTEDPGGFGECIEVRREEAGVTFPDDGTSREGRIVPKVRADEFVDVVHIDDVVRIR